jgi:hypothetical protein
MKKTTCDDSIYGTVDGIHESGIVDYDTTLQCNITTSYCQARLSVLSITFGEDVEGLYAQDQAPRARKRSKRDSFSHYITCCNSPDVTVSVRIRSICAPSYLSRIFL